MPLASAAGIMPSIATTISMNIGRTCAFAPETTASSSVVPGSLIRRLISATYNSPPITATPNSVTNPTAAETDRWMPRRYSARMPPTSEKGTLTSTSAASRTDAKATNSSAEHDENRHREDEGQARTCPLQVLELPTPADAVTGRQRHGSGDFGLRLRHESALVPVSDVRTHRDLPLVLAAPDDARTAHGFDAGELTQGHAPPPGVAPESARWPSDRCARLRHIPHRHVEPPSPEDRRHRAATDRQLDHVLDVTDVEAIAGEHRAIDRDPQL